ncbi:MAG: hypothetical protein IT210_15865 [Armatimonadetes bacterium]|nr:hypothetical protein [Armatimonadota bacterium]
MRCAAKTIAYIFSFFVIVIIFIVRKSDFQAFWNYWAWLNLLSLPLPNRWLCFWWQRPPLVSEAIQALQEASAARKIDTVAAMLDALLADIAAMQKEQSPILLIDSFSSPDTLDQTAAHYALTLRGGQAVAPLLEAEENFQWDQNDAQVRLWIKRTLKRIGQETSRRLSRKASSLLCPHCLTRYRRFKARLGGLFRAAYWGCRTCQDSKDFLECPDAVALLDAAAGPDLARDGKSLLVNWLARGDLFDFDRILIRNASDAQIERFAVQAGNDMDSFRRERYREMPCTVECPITQNTRRILDSIFGRVRCEAGEMRSFRKGTDGEGQIWLNRRL